MAVHTLRCPNCGADLEVVEGTETIRCKFCGARCQLEGRGANQHLTLIAQQLGRIEEHAARTSAEIEALRQQQSYGLASQYQTDQALRRAAAAHETAAQEAAYASHLQSATHEALLHAGQQQAAATEGERQALLALRSRYRFWRVWRWPLVLLLLLFGFLGGGIASEVLPKDVQTLGFGGVFVGSLVLAFTLEKLSMAVSTRAGRKYNERAFLYGLPDVPVKSKAEAEWEKRVR